MVEREEISFLDLMREIHPGKNKNVRLMNGAKKGTTQEGTEVYYETAGDDVQDD